MADFLLELLTEEIPARMQRAAAEGLRERFVSACAARGLGALDVEAHATPRRLALLAWGLPDATEPTREERRGPRADAPEGAVAGFKRSAGVETLEARDDPKGRFWYAVIARPGRGAAEVLAEAAREAAEGLAWPKSMRWGAASASMDSPRWVRPLTGVVALLDDAVVPVTVLGVAAGRTTLGHRFMSAGVVEVERPGTYAARLRAAYVVLDAAERGRIIEEGARACAEAAGLELVPDAGLVAENAGLTEWPVPLLGRFDPAFLEVPREVIQLTMRTNQKYFACVDGEGKLAPAFVCVANLAAADGGAAIVEGNRRVLAARLADARFFWERDLAEWRAAGDLWDHAKPRLERIVFHEKLGTMADKAERVGRLARWLVESGAVPVSKPVIPALSRDLPSSSYGSAEGRWVPGQARDDEDSGELAALAERAGRLAKADLASAMVGEFPELQGVMGGYYARACGEPEEVAAAVREHYAPAGPSDAVPSAPVSVAVALADKLDTLVGFFAVGEQPTGSRDPFALRRAALGLINLLQRIGARLPLAEAAIEAMVALPVQNVSLPASLGEHSYWEHARLFPDEDGPAPDIGKGAFGQPLVVVLKPYEVVSELLGFFADRLKVQQREAGVRHDLIDAVFALGGEDDLVRLLARVRALQGFVETEDGAELLAGYRRAANILAIEEKRDGREYRGAVTARDGDPPAQRALAGAVEAAAAEAADAVAREAFGAAMAALARLRPFVDRFFAEVTVNAPDPRDREERLKLLARIVEAARTVADFGRIEG